MTMLPAKFNEMSLIPEVDEKLTELERSIIRQEDNPIKHIPEVQATKFLGGMVEHIMRDVGIVGNDPMYTIRFAQVVFKYYSHFTLSDIKMAFELVSIGNLDPFLPKNQNGPDRNHYSRFSIEYVSKVLSAYKRFKDSIRSKVALNLPMPEKSECEKSKQMIDYIRMLNEDLIAYRDENKEFTLKNPLMALKLFKHIKITSSIPSFEGSNDMEDFLKEGEKLVNRSRFRSDKGNETVGSILKTKTANEFYMRKVVEIFDFLIKNDRLISDYVKLDN